MASTETRPSFRLPWTAGTGESDVSSNQAEEPNASEEAHGGEETQAPEMIETAAEAPTAADSEQSGAAPARRATKFMAELSRAMQAAAEHSRNETLARFEAEAKAVVEEMHASATSEVADLRRKADDDVAAIREWSKAEIARIREETEARVAVRKRGLDVEIEAHAAGVEARAERVTESVAAFEAEMIAFFERLNVEEDPTRIATMAETMPDPPNLADLVASLVTASPAIAPARVAPAAPAAPRAPLAEAEIDFAAAEAEAASFDGDVSALGGEDEDESPTAALGEPAGEAVAEPIAELEAARTSSDAQATTRLLVVGLVSVASIANFKRSLGRIAGVWSIGVSSGPDGEFVFTVSHDAGLALANEIVSMPNFESHISGESDGEIQVSAQDRDMAG